MTITDEVLGAADQNMVGAWRAVLAGSPIPGDVHDENVVLLSSGLPVPLFNPRELAALVSGPSLLGVAAFTALLGTVRGEPTGTSAVFTSDVVAGIYNVATVPQGRGNGIGAAMTWSAVNAGREAGATCAILQSSEQGEPVYARMGFATPTRYRQFEPAAPPT